MDMIINCPKCNIAMKDMRHLGMGPNYECLKCDLTLWKRGDQFLKITGTGFDEDGNSILCFKEIKIDDN
jgi:hypothetical protein